MKNSIDKLLITNCRLSLENHIASYNVIILYAIKFWFSKTKHKQQHSHKNVIVTVRRVICHPYYNPGKTKMKAKKNVISDVLSFDW